MTVTDPESSEANRMVIVTSVSEIELVLADDGGLYQTGRNETFTGAFGAVVPRNYTIPTADRSQTFTDLRPTGEGGVDARVLRTPGH